MEITIKDLIKDRLEEHGKTINMIYSVLGDKIERAIIMITDTIKSGGKIILFGNGGSASDAQHIAGELVVGFKNHHRKAISAIALTTNTAVITAISNDYSYEDIFSRQLEALGSRNDLVIALSTSGKSRNVLRGLSEAKKMSIRTIALTGESGGQLMTACDLVLNIPSKDTARIQEAYLLIGHIICEAVELLATKND